MAMHPFLHPSRFGFELIYTIIIVLFCFLVYYRTKLIYDLTKYKGIQYFRNAFLFFGLAYAARFILHLFLISMAAFDFFIPKGMMFPLMMIPVGYLSTMAIYYLAYSTVWKKIKYRQFIIFSNITAIIVSAGAFIYRSHIILSLIQLGLLVFTIIISTIKHKKRKKISEVRVLYLLIGIFWLLNMFVLGPRRFIGFEIKLVFQIISVLVFLMIYYKVRKWVK